MEYYKSSTYLHLSHFCTCVTHFRLLAYSDSLFFSDADFLRIHCLVIVSCFDLATVSFFRSSEALCTHSLTHVRFLGFTYLNDVLLLYILLQLV